MTVEAGKGDQDRGCADEDGGAGNVVLRSSPRFAS